MWRFGSRSVDPVLALQFADVCRHKLHFTVRYALDLRHVSKVPVMCPNPILGRHDEGHVGMMRRLVNFMDQRRRNTLLACRIGPMAGRAFCIEDSLPDLRVLRKIGRDRDLLDRRTIFDLTQVWRRHGMAHGRRRIQHLISNQHKAANKERPDKQSCLVHQISFTCVPIGVRSYTSSICSL